MSDEYFDVVDADDVVLERRMRAEVHRLGLRHRAVHILVFNRAGEIFLQKRSMTKDSSPGLWDSSASGHVDAGETYDAAAVRELSEELGVAGDPVRQFKVPACEDTGQEFVWVYRMEAEGPFECHPEEIDAGEWYTVEAVTAWMAASPGTMASAFRLVWQLYCRKSAERSSGKAT